LGPGGLPGDHPRREVLSPVGGAARHQTALRMGYPRRRRRPPSRPEKVSAESAFPRLFVVFWPSMVIFRDFLYLRVPDIAPGSKSRVRPSNWLWGPIYWQCEVRQEGSAFAKMAWGLSGSTPSPNRTESAPIGFGTAGCCRGSATRRTPLSSYPPGSACGNGCSRCSYYLSVESFPVWSSPTLPRVARSSLSH